MSNLKLPAKWEERGAGSRLMVGGTWLADNHTELWHVTK